MNSLIRFTSLALLVSSVARAEETPPVVRAVLYPDGATVFRATAVECKKGTTSVRFPGLPTSLDVDSVRAGVRPADGDSPKTQDELNGVSLVERVEDQAFGDEVKQIDEQIRQLETKEKVLERDGARAEADRMRADSLRQASLPFLQREGMVEGKPDIAGWTRALDQTRTALEHADELTRATSIEEREVAKKLADLRRRRGAPMGRTAPVHVYDATVVVSCSGRAVTELSYVISEASWSPAYEAHANESNGTIAFDMLADVKQNTGELWRGVSLTLSSALSHRDSRPPRLQPLYLGAQEHADEKKVLVKREEAAEHLHEATGKDDKNAEVAAVDQGLSVQLDVPGNASVNGDGEPLRVAVERATLPATFSLVSVPKVLPVVFTRGVARNGLPHPLLPGPIDLFARGSFLGTGHIDRVAENDDLKLAFGLDENVKVRRVVQREQSAQTGLFGTTRRLEYAYRIELAASGKEPSTVEVQEHVPVSELDDVKVTIDKETTPGANVVASDGLMTWSVQLKPGEKKNVELHFAVEVPSSYDSAGL